MDTTPTDIKSHYNVPPGVNNTFRAESGYGQYLWYYSTAMLLFIPLLLVLVVGNLCPSYHAYLWPRFSMSRQEGRLHNKFIDKWTLRTHKGRALSHTVNYGDIQEYALIEMRYSYKESDDFIYQCHILAVDPEVAKYSDTDIFVICRIKLVDCISLMPIYRSKDLMMMHGFSANQANQMTRMSRSCLATELLRHRCDSRCKNNFVIFKKLVSRKGAIKQSSPGKDQDLRPLTQTFPPKPSDRRLEHKIITDFCTDVNMKTVAEEGCAVCGELTLTKNLMSMGRLKDNLQVLIQGGVTRLERQSRSEPIKEIEVPILATGCQRVCRTCNSSLQMGERPRNALANGLWVGDVPAVLSNLRFAERMLVSRIRHNYCVVKVASGGRKLKANAIMFSNPMQRIYDKLPPPCSELDEVLAYIFTGSTKPTAEDMKQTPLLVRRNAVAEALEWLVVNHSGYDDVVIDRDALASYPDEGPPVTVLYYERDSNKDAESQSLDDMEAEDGIESGECLFTVHGLVGEQLNTVSSTKILRAEALKHMNSNGKVLAIGHNDVPESIYKNPTLYPLMFPCLFPYGLGGLGMSHTLKDVLHKRHLLMYYDKRFQVDPHFPLIAFNHEQIKSATRSAFVLADSKRFDDIANRILKIDVSTLTQLIKRMESQGSHIDPETDAEKECFKILNDIDCVAGKVNGTSTSKKILRNEIWSLISYIGAPSWFITFSPADVKSPICIYWANTKTDYNLNNLSQDASMRIVTKNPVAGARFFHFVVQMFIKHVLGVGTKRSGLYGNTKAYYGTVEQQGRLTLHLHMLLWIDGAFTPQEICDKIQNDDSEFTKSLLLYLESVNKGEFITGTMDHVREHVEKQSKTSTYVDPTRTTPSKPPPICKRWDANCNKCAVLDKWWEKYNEEVDDIILKSNVHTCSSGIKKNGEVVKNKDYKGCLNNKWKKCKARFPRKIVSESAAEKETGRIELKKMEEFINTFTTVVTYLLRCNSDVTCLHSGTAVKAVVAYVSDYISKFSLKTHTIFDTIRSVYARHLESLNTTSDRADVARRLMTKIVNSLTVKMEIGAPMASMYLLGNPDHYTNYTFVPFYWKSYVNYIYGKWAAENPLLNEIEESEDEKVLMIKTGDTLYPSRLVDDYMYRPHLYAHFNLYNWVRLSRRHTVASRKKKSSDGDSSDSGTQEALVLDDVAEISDEVDSSINDSDGESDNSEETSSCTVDTDSTEGSESNEPKHVKGFPFLSDHPLAATHQVHCVRENHSIVPNFIGGALPREKDGNMNYFAITMLTLFKPWRKIEDLKSPDQQWETIFNLHQFSDREKEIMKYFQVRYECLDARDDYNAIMRSQGSDEETPDPIIDDKFNDELCIEGHYDAIVEDSITDEQAYMSTEGVIGARRRDNRREIRDTLSGIGWLNTSSAGDHNIYIDKDRVIPESYIPGKTWRIIVESKKQEKIRERMSRNISSTSITAQSTPFAGVHNTVRVVTMDELQNSQYIKHEDDQVEQVAHEFSLNEEQERAYRIAAKHVLGRETSQLKMYIGGMGGTGKTQVLKAIATLLERRGEKHRLIVMAPTGTAAALLGGSTYHYILGMREGDNNKLTAKRMVQIKERLEGVDLIFFDEVSMLSCMDMYKICERLALATGNESAAFGGINIIFAGDFAQLPPVIGKENAALYSGCVGVGDINAVTQNGQREAMGKAMWHQVDTVVILRQNMRQRTQSEKDSKLRKALENMRYKACTSDDIVFLRSLIVGSKNTPASKIAQPKYRHQSIITSWNDKKDEINRLGVHKFSRDTGQELHTFYSSDEPTMSRAETQPKNKRKSKRSDKRFKIRHISPAMREALWSLPPNCNNELIPGTLSICLGLPVMIRRNEATELCMTRGQEGTVAGWQESIGAHGKPILDVLFVRLTNPPKSVKFNGLPENVVPLTASASAIDIKFDSGWSTAITRHQIQVLPNFSMTDYASQGKTRDVNMTDVSNCPTHQSYYTCLSRSSRADDTVIMTNFKSALITGNASGWLRQEFREMELLDEITRLRHERSLPECVRGASRRSLIREFRSWKGLHYIPKGVHPAVRWKKDEIFEEQDLNTRLWAIVGKKKPHKNTSNSRIQSPTLVPDSTALKRKVLLDDQSTPNKRSKLNLEGKCNVSLPTVRPETLQYKPVGLTWDAENYSCSYDCFFTALRHIWSGGPAQWNSRLTSMNIFMKELTIGMQANELNLCQFEAIRDRVRLLLHESSPTKFPYGKSFVAMPDLARELLQSFQIIHERRKICSTCMTEDSVGVYTSSHSAIHVGDPRARSIAEWLSNPVEHTAYMCIRCSQRTILFRLLFHAIPSLMYVSLEWNSRDIRISETVMVSTTHGTQHTFRLKAVIYWAAHHFTCRLISDDRIWFHDGITTGRVSIQEFHTSLAEINTRGESIAIGAIYALAY